VNPRNTINKGGGPGPHEGGKLKEKRLRKTNVRTARTTVASQKKKHDQKKRKRNDVSHVENGNVKKWGEKTKKNGGNGRVRQKTKKN